MQLDSSYYIYEKEPAKYGYYEHCKCPLNVENYNTENTIFINLLPDEEVIILSFNATVRNEIRRCEKDDKPTLDFNISPTKDDIEQLLQKYVEFAKSKHLERILDGNIPYYRSYLGLLAKNNCLVIAKAYDSKNECVVTDALFMNKNVGIARLNVSISNFRYQDKEHQKINSRLNKWLKYQECLYFKKNGIKYYDLGGAPRNKVDDEQINRVRYFKLSFSQNFVNYYCFNIQKPRSWWHNFRKKYFRKNKNSITTKKSPTICLLFNKTIDDSAYSIVNNLSDSYCFDIKLWKEYKKHNDYDIVHILDKNLFGENVGSIKTIKQDFNLENVGISPLEYFYAKNRTGDLKILNRLCNKAETIIATEGYEQYNDFDVYIANKNDMSLIHAMACGCFPICTQDDFSNKLIRHKENGYILQSYDKEELDEAINWCTEHIKFIRKQSVQIAKEIQGAYSWEIMAQGYKKMYEGSLKGDEK